MNFPLPSAHKIRPAIVHPPLRRPLDLAIRQMDHQRPDQLVFIVRMALGKTLHQTGRAKSKQQMLVVDEVQRGRRCPRQQIKAAQRMVIQRYGIDACGRRRRFGLLVLAAQAEAVSRPMQTMTRGPKPGKLVFRPLGSRPRIVHRYHCPTNGPPAPNRFGRAKDMDDGASAPRFSLKANVAAGRFKRPNSPSARKKPMRLRPSCFAVMHRLARPLQQLLGRIKMAGQQDADAETARHAQATSS